MDLTRLLLMGNGTNNGQEAWRRAKSCRVHGSLVNPVDGGAGGNGGNRKQARRCFETAGWQWHAGLACCVYDAGQCSETYGSWACGGGRPVGGGQVAGHGAL